ncbi:hypothetical protein [Zhengella mangrovi]|uniref:hypothetical protein n=1 Tax=Zhengella mangrovi TaxID=1982044 RepID=UPI0010548AF0|nr:hypothetical protein [Zhengella mangrovi]
MKSAKPTPMKISSSAKGRAKASRAAAVSLSRVEGFVMSKDMKDTFRNFDKAGMTHEQRRMALHAKYGKKTG